VAALDEAGHVLFQSDVISLMEQRLPEVVASALHEFLLRGEVVCGVEHHAIENKVDVVFGPALFARGAQVVDDREEFSVLPVDHSITGLQ